MAEFAPFDLGRVFATAEQIKSMRRQSVLDSLQAQYLQGQIARAPAQEARAAAADKREQASFDQEQAVVGLRIANMAAAEVAQNPSAAGRWSKILKVAVPGQDWEVPSNATPEQIQAGARQIFESTSAALQAYNSGSGAAQAKPSALVEQYSLYQAQGGKLPFVDPNGRGKDFVTQFSQSQVGAQYGAPVNQPGIGVVQPSRTDPARNVTLTPEADAAAAAADRAGAEAAARAEAESDATRNQKAPALQTLEYVADQFSPILDKTAQGGPLGVIGRAGTVFDYEDATRFDNLREQLSTELRTVFRIPGEGTLSDREQAQYGLQLPNRNYSPAVNKAILEDVRTRASLRIGMDESGDAEAGGQFTIRQID